MPDGYGEDSDKMPLRPVQMSRVWEDLGLGDPDQKGFCWALKLYSEQFPWPLEVLECQLVWIPGLLLGLQGGWSAFPVELELVVWL
jgi:hypothetical protein